MSSEISPVQRPQWGKIVALGVVMLFVGQYILKPNTYTWLDFANLAIHEAGHIVFSFLGEFIQFLGGTLLQVGFPAVFVWYFWRQQQHFSAALCLFWVSQNLFNVSVYVADARSMQLELVGGGEHDWNYLLFEMGLLMHDQAVARFVYLVGLGIYIWASIWAIRLLRPNINKPRRAHIDDYYR